MHVKIITTLATAFIIGLTSTVIMHGQELSSEKAINKAHRERDKVDRKEIKETVKEIRKAQNDIYKLLLEIKKDKE